MTVRPIQPPGWPRPAGYSDGVVARGGGGGGRVVAVAGQVGWDPVTHRFAARDFAGQAAQALRNVAAVLAAGGAAPQHVVRLTWFVTDRQAYLTARAELGTAYREVFGGHYPAMSVVVTGLLEEAALVEIEATAVVSGPPPAGVLISPE